MEEELRIFRERRQNATDNAMVSAAFACPYHVYRNLQKHAKARTRTRRLLVCIYLEELVKRLPTPMDVHCIPLVVIRTYASAFSRLLTVSPTLFRRLRLTYKVYLLQVAVAVDPCNLWYAARFHPASVAAHAAVLRTHACDWLHVHGETASLVAEAVLPYDKAIAVYCAVLPRFKALQFMNRGLDEEQKFLRFSGTMEELQREALSRYMHKERVLAAAMGLHNRLGAHSMLNTLPPEVFKLITHVA